MEKKLLEIFKNQLIDKREEIFNEAGKTLTDMTDQNINIPDPNDRATVESGRSFELRIRDRERKLLSKIEAARALGLPVLMIDRPALPDRLEVQTPDEVLAWVHDTTERGV